MSNRFSLFLIVFVLLGFVVSSFFYRVLETETAVKLEFGQMVESDIAPGLHVKIPVVNKIVKIDRRLLTLDAEPSSVFTEEEKRLEVDSFVKWRVLSAEKFYKATGGDPAVAGSLLAARVNDKLRNEFGARTLHEVVSGERDEMMTSLTSILNKSAAEELGVDIVDVRVKRIDFPQDVRSSVFDRMRADRQKEARQYRAEGTEQAEKIRADAEREKVVIEAEAYKEAEETRGEGDAKSAAIYASAYNKDADFYAFVRRLTAYETSFANKGDVLLVNPDSDFFRFLNDINGN